EAWSTARSGDCYCNAICRQDQEEKEAINAPTGRQGIMADLLPGTSDSIIRENVRALKSQGYSEVDALARANKYAKGSTDPDETEDAELADVQSDEPDSQDRQFVVVTKDFSGLGWAKKLQEEGETVTLAHKCNEEEPKF